jgi:lysophospholipase L1-like esterase
MRQEAIPLSVQQPFTYIVPITLAASTAGSYSLILANDSEFDLQTIEASTIVAGVNETATTITNNFTVLIRDVTGGRDYSTAPVPRFLLAGIAPTNVVTEGRCIRFPRKQQFEFQFLNLTTGSLAITLSLKGYKVFQRAL